MWVEGGSGRASGSPDLKYHPLASFTQVVRNGANPMVVIVALTGDVTGGWISLGVNHKGDIH